MLDLMRKHAKSWLIKAALGGIIIVFIFWYGWSGPGEERGNYVAKVNQDIITWDYYSSVYNSELEKIRLRFRGRMPEGLLDRLDLKKKVVKGLVDQQLLMQESKRLGFFVTGQDLVEDIRTNPAFQVNGTFDDRAYKLRLAEIKLSPGAYENIRKHEMLEAQLATLLTDGVKTDPEEVKKLWHFQNDKLVLSILLVKPGTEKQRAAVDADALKAFFKKNEKKYELPASLKLEYVLFSWRDVQNQVSVPEDEVLSYYHNHPKEFTSPEAIRARHILIKVQPDADKEKMAELKKKAEDILARIKGGEDFAKVASKESQDEATGGKGGDLGFFARGTMGPELEKAAFDLGPGEVAGPVFTKLGYHLIKLEEKKPEKLSEFEVVKEKLLAKLLEEKARKKATEDSEKFYEEVYRTEDLEGPAKKFGLEVKKAESITKAGGIPNAGKDPKLMDEAFQLKKGEISRLVKTGDDYVVIKLVERTGERIPDLEAVQDVVLKDFVAEEALTAARKKAEKVIEALKKDDTDPEKVAKQFGLSWEKLDPLSRTAQVAPRLGNAREVSEMLTSVSPTARLYPSPVSVPEGIAVVLLSEVERASDELFAKQGEDFERWIKEVRRTEFLTGWLRLLEERAKVTVMEKLL